MLAVRDCARYVGQHIPKYVSQSFSRHTKLANIALTHVRNARAWCSTELNGGTFFALRNPKCAQLFYETPVVKEEKNDVPLSSLIGRVSEGRGMEALFEMIGRKDVIEQTLFEQIGFINEELKCGVSENELYWIRNYLRYFFDELEEYKDNFVHKEKHTYLCELIGYSRKLLLQTRPFNEAFLPVYLFVLNNLFAIMQRNQQLGFDSLEHLQAFIDQNKKEIDYQFDILFENISSSFRGPFIRHTIFTYKRNEEESLPFHCVKKCKKSMELHRNAMLARYKKEYIDPAWAMIKMWEKSLQDGLNAPAYKS